MLWVAGESWPWLLLSGLLGAACTCAALLRRGPAESALVSAPGPAPRPAEPDRRASASPLPGGAAPGAAYVVKAKRASRLYHPPASPSYARTIADLWFTSEDAARAAGYFRWDDPQRPRRRPARTSVPRID